MKHTLLIDVEAASPELAMDCLASVVAADIGRLQCCALDDASKGDYLGRDLYRKCIAHRQAMVDSIRPVPGDE